MAWDPREILWEIRSRDSKLRGDTGSETRVEKNRQIPQIQFLGTDSRLPLSTSEHHIT